MTIGEALKSITVSQLFLIVGALVGFVSTILSLLMPDKAALITQITGAITTFGGALGAVFTSQASQVQRASQIAGVQVKVDANTAPSNIVNLAVSKAPGAENVTLK